MYFIAFKKAIQPSLPDRIIYVVEHIVSQILVNANEESLREAIDEGKLAEVLYQELEFTGRVPKQHLTAVKDYLIDQEKHIKKVAQEVTVSTIDDNRRFEITQPVSTPEL